MKIHGVCYIFCWNLAWRPLLRNHRFILLIKFQNIISIYLRKRKLIFLIWRHLLNCRRILFLFGFHFIFKGILLFLLYGWLWLILSIILPCLDLRFWCNTQNLWKIRIFTLGLFLNYYYYYYCCCQYWYKSTPLNKFFYWGRGGIITWV